MALRRSEKILLGATGIVILAMGGMFFFSGSGTSSAVLRDQRDRLQAEVKSKLTHLRRAETLTAQMKLWERRALPTDHEAARTLYQNWLLALTDRNHLRRARVEPAGEGRWQRSAYFAIPFTVRGQASLGQLVRLLYGFYQSGNLDQIRHLSIKPVDTNSQDLEVLLQIEALSLTTADRTDRLTVEKVQRMTHGDLGEYASTIADRKIFSPYAPPGAPPPAEKPPAEPPKFDAAKFVFLTAVTEVDGRPQAWLLSRTTGQTYKLAQGEKFPVNDTDAVVQRIGERDAEIELDNQRYTVPLGGSVR